MNANKWPLQRVRRIEFETPLPLNECMRRVEQLNEPQQPPIRKVFNAPPEDLYRDWQATVRRVGQSSGQVIYNVVLSGITDPFISDKVTEGARVALLPQSYGTRIIIHYFQRQQIAYGAKEVNARVLWGIMFFSLIVLLCANITNLMAFNPLSYAAVVVFMVSLLLTNDWVRRRSKQPYLLLKQIHNAFDLTYRAKSATGYQKDIPK
ncbi:MAG: hypothetical protein K8L91_30285 [Anaerolineae bacterium]|nr:hypothetical protein [Anaerolineae bacterium]